jgi:hypothetical protein
MLLENDMDYHWGVTKDEEEERETGENIPP